MIGLDLRADETAPASLRFMDVTDEQAWAQLAHSLVADPPNILVNNAGGLVSSAILHEHDSDTWRRTLDLNLTSVFFAMRAFIPLMLPRRSGSIVNVGSVSGLTGQADAPAYQAAKAGVAMLSRNAAVTYAPFGIRVNTISPSIVVTDALAGEAEARTAAFTARVPLGRPAQPSEIAAAAVFLAGDESSFITGADIAVDGGYLA